MQCIVHSGRTLIYQAWSGRCSGFWGMSTTYFVVVLLVCFLLAVPRAAQAQGAEDATALTQQINELGSQGRYPEAASLAQRALVIQEKALGLDHPEVALALYN